MTTDSYDDIPYDSTPFADTHPAHLCVLGRMFGLDAPAPETARILELGCATGGNIIPLAYYLPNAKITGIELSAGQVAVAQELIKGLALSNIEVRQGDIMALGNELGQFDYIIAHGVYSWVPEVVRQRILQLCRNHLSPHGIAYISYNTLPGWKMRGTLRDMLLHHTRNGKSPRERLALAYQLFDLLEQALVHDEALSSRYLRNEITGLRKSHPSYLYHEYLEEINQPFLFSDFAAEIRQQQLNYLCDVELANDIPSTLGAEAASALDGIDDLIEQGQYCDFVTNRYFRRSLLCHADAPLQRELSLAQLTTFAYSALLTPEKPASFKQPRSQTFRSPSGLNFEVEHPLAKAALQHLAERYPDAIAFDELITSAQALVVREGASKYAEDSDALLGELISLFAHQAIRLWPQPRHIDTPLSDRPRLNALARQQVRLKLGHLATVSHTTLSLDAFSAKLAALLDSHRGTKELAELMILAIEQGEISLEGSGKRLESTRLKANVAVNIQRLLSLFAREGVLE